MGPGNIFKRMVGIKMSELDRAIEELGLEYIEVYTTDKDGKPIKTRLYWQNFVASATIKIYACSPPSKQHRHEGPYAVSSQFLA